MQSATVHKCPGFWARGAALPATASWRRCRASTIRSVHCSTEKALGVQHHIIQARVRRVLAEVLPHELDGAAGRWRRP